MDVLLPQTDGIDPEALGLRERKKRETRRALHLAALELVRERGMAGVSTDDIAAAAGVSARTFFNYYATKEAALTGGGADLPFRVTEFVDSRPPQESDFTVCAELARRLVWMATRDEDAWRLRRTIIRENPELGPTLSGRNHDASTALVIALQARSGDSTGRPWLAPMLALLTFDAVRVANQVANTHVEALATVDEVMAALAPGLG